MKRLSKNVIEQRIRARTKRLGECSISISVSLAKAIGESLRREILGKDILDPDFVFGIQLRFVFDTS